MGRWWRERRQKSKSNWPGVTIRHQRPIRGGGHVKGGPLVAGKKAEIKIKLARGDNSPVLSADLMVMHTQPIHLLIEEPGLGDYHHEHPVPTNTPGEYAFSFTPLKSSPYRIWAD